MNHPQPILVGLHIPKCAGTTLLMRVEACLPAHAVYQTTSLMRNFREGQPELLQILNPQRLRFIFGHSTHEQMVKVLGQRVVLFTGLRDPISRTQSVVNYEIRLAAQQGKPAPSVESILKRSKDHMCWLLVSRFPTLAGEKGSLADRAFRVLENFHIVYFTDNFEETSNAIFRLLNIKPDAVNFNERGKEGNNIDIPEHYVRQDSELYQRAREMFFGADIGARLRMSQPERLKLFATPPDLDKLREFLYKYSFKEYSAWMDIDDVIHEKLRILEELSMEVRHYMKAVVQDQKRLKP